MSKPLLLVVGCGDLGLRVGSLVGPLGWHVCGVKRRPPEALDHIHEWIAADYAAAGSLDFAEAMRPDFVLATFTPTSMDTAGYRQGFSMAAANLLSGLGRHRPALVLMVSSTRVYAETAGAWVDESSALTNADERGVLIADAERQFLDSGHAVSVVRCGGIYGAPRGRLLNKILQGRIAPAQPLRYTNRIHRDDCAGFLVHLLQCAQRGEPVQPIYNGVDNDPAIAHEVETWIAGQLGVAVDDQAVSGNSPAVSHKRCSNKLLRESGFVLRYPDYKAGYGEICRNY